jgi:hypothetical protein
MHPSDTDAYKAIDALAESIQIMFRRPTRIVAHSRFRKAEKVGSMLAGGFMRISLCVIGFLVSIGLQGSAFGWGHEGHELIGSIADQKLSMHARQQVSQILGFELRVAAPWADCVRSVVRNQDGSFKYSPDPKHPEYTVACTSFETPEEIARMEDYISRNWSNCFYETGHGCDEAYHFDDVAVQHSRYDRSYVGTSAHDVVSAIQAAIMVLKDMPGPSPFSIKDKKEALFLLSHFVGDIHQPLHVGAVYLDSTGKLIDPDSDAPDDPTTHTAGGNLISDQGTNFHSEWDQIPPVLGHSADATTMGAANAVPNTTGPLETWPVAWATDTIVASHSAFAGASFAGVGASRWVVKFANHQQYVNDQDKIKKAQIAKGGARLAQVLNAIWP